MSETNDRISARRGRGAWAGLGLLLAGALTLSFVQQEKFSLGTGLEQVDGLLGLKVFGKSSRKDHAPVAGAEGRQPSFASPSSKNDSIAATDSIFPSSGSKQEGPPHTDIDISPAKGRAEGVAEPYMPKKVLSSAAPRGVARLAIATILRGPRISQYENGQESGTNHSDISLLKRMQSLYLHGLMTQVETYNAKAKSPVAQLVIVTSSGSLAELARRVLGPSVQLEITDPGFEMRALWALKTFKRVLYLRPGNRLRSDWTLAKIENALRNRNCLLRAPSNVAAQEAESKDRNLRGQVSDTFSHPTSGDPSSRRRLTVPGSKITEQNHAVDIENFPKLSVPLIDFKNDARMRPVQALWISPNESLHRSDVSRYRDETLFRPETLAECTSGIVAGYGGEMHECQFAKIVEEIPDAQLLAGTPRQGRYPLPVDIAWKGESTMQFYGKLANLLYGQLELEDAKQCAKVFQVEKYGNLAKEQIVSRLARPPLREPRQGRYSHQAMVMKTHSVSSRINQTLHAWARDLHQEGGEVIAAFLGKNGSRDDYHFLETEHKRGAKVGFEVIRLDSEGIVNNLIPYEAQATFAKGCETSFHGLLCSKSSTDNKPIFSKENRNVDRLMWLHTVASSTAIFKHMLDTRPDLEFLWMFDYDVVFTGKLSTLFDTVNHDDADLLAVSFKSAATPEEYIRKEAEPHDVSIWAPAAKIWQPTRRIGRVYAGGLRLSRRMVQWSLEAAFTPLNWVVDEVFYFDTCERHKPLCKYTPFQAFELVGPSSTFNIGNSKDFQGNLMKNKGTPQNKLCHPVKDKNFSAELEPWLVV